MVWALIKGHLLVVQFHFQLECGALSKSEWGINAVSLVPCESTPQLAHHVLWTSLEEYFCLPGFLASILSPLVLSSGKPKPDPFVPSSL